MLIECLKKDIQASAVRLDDIPGIYICRFKGAGVSDKILLPFPMEKTPRFVEALFCTEGEIIIQRANDIPYRAVKGNVLLLTNMTEYTSINISKNMQGILVAIDNCRISKQFFSLCDILKLDLEQLKSEMREWPESIIIVNNSWTQSLFELLDFMPEEAAGKYCFLKSLELLYVLSARSCGESGNDRAEESRRMCRIVLDAKRYMEEHLSEKITIIQLSRMLSVSPTYLKAEFRRIHGMSIHRWLMELRMRRAEELICCTDQPIYQIAQEVGYEGMSQFSAVFKKHYGVTPGQFKKMSKTITRCPFQ